MKLHLPLTLAGAVLLQSSPVLASPQVTVDVTSVVANDATPGARFGTDVAIDGSIIVAGAWGDANFQGSAYVLRGTAGDVTQEAKLTRNGGAANDLFGRSVDVSGETIVVGASRAFGAEGRVVVFENTSSPANWTEVASLAASDPGAGDELGLRVAIDGDTIVAGAPTQAAFRGAAYVFRRGSGGVWAQEAKLLASGLTPADLFGIDVCISGDRILVGACGVSVNRGAVYVFERSGSSWSQTDAITSQAPLAGDLFGISVAFDGGRAVMGASQNAGGTAIGFAEVHRLLDGMLSYETTLNPVNATPGIGFGNRVDVSGEFVAASQGLSGFNATGSVTLYVAGQTGFSGLAPITPQGVAAGDEYGGGVDVLDSQGTTILVNGGMALQDRILVGGARLADIAVLQAEGRVFVSRINNRYSGYCRGESSLTCGVCPCGNAPPPSPLAGGCLNSDGRSALLSASGEASISNDTLRFRVFNATSDTFALLQSGPNAPPVIQNPACAPGSGLSPANFDGLRCIGGGTTRHGSRSTDSLGNIGISTNGWGPPNGPVNGLLSQNGAVAGQTVNFQAFYRDNDMFQCQTGQNTTNGVRVLCTP